MCSAATIRDLSARHGITIHTSDILPREVPWLRRGAAILVRPNEPAAAMDAIADVIGMREREGA